MADSPILYALRRKYGLLLGRLQANRKKAAAIKRDIAHVEAVIRMFRDDEPLNEIAPIRPRVNRQWTTGAVWTRVALDILRTANGPMTARELAERVVAQAAPEAAVKDVQCSLYPSLRLREGTALIRHDGHPMRWSVAP